MSFARRFLASLRESTRFAPVQPALKAGLRAAIATVVPLLVAHLLAWPGAAWLSLGGFSTALGDRGGPYRTRAITMGGVVVSGALLVSLGAMSGSSALLAVPVMLLCAFACGYARVFGPAWGTVGTLVVVMFAVSLASPATGLRDGVERGAAAFAGGLWAMGLSLLVWPIRMYWPARRAVADCYRAVADYAADVVRLSSTAAASRGWEEQVPREHARIRQVLETARDTLAATRRGRPGESGRGARLLVLFEAASQLFARVIVLADVLESVQRDALHAAARAGLERALAGCADTLRGLAALVEANEQPASAQALAWGPEDVRSALAAAPPEPGQEVARARYVYAATLVSQLREEVGAAAEVVAGIGDDRRLTRDRPAADLAASGAAPSAWTRIRENLTFDSVVLRHSLRVAIITALAVALTRSLGLTRGYWVTITVVIILQPYTGETFIKALQRVIGTVLGGVLAAGLAVAIHDPLGIMIAVAVLVGISVSLMPINYALYSIFLTPPFVLLAEVGSGDWHLAHVRVINTLMGGALALAGMRLLWPSPEHARFPEQAAETLRANREHFRLVMDAHLRDVDEAQPALAEARRRMGLTAINAETSFQRLLSETSHGPGELESLMTTLVYTRRFAASVIALAQMRREDARAHREVLGPWADAVEAALAELAEAVARGRAPSPLPDFAQLLGQAHAAPGQPVAPSQALHEAVLLSQLERVVRHLTVLHGAVARRAGGSHPRAESQR